jgi:2-beta-glucuronyltransferase
MTMKSLMVSAHDWRSKRRINVHFIAEALRRRGPTRWYAFGYSLLSRLKGDHRAENARATNVIEEVDGVACFQEETAVHPFNLHRPWLLAVERAAFAAYAGASRTVLDAWAAESDLIIVESGIPAILIERLRRAAPKAKLVYLASDDLETVGCSRAIVERFEAAFASLDLVVLPSPLLLGSMPDRTKCIHVPHGFERGPFDRVTASPFGGGRHAVSVGSMLFDRGVFEAAAPAFPEVTFHVVGGGPESRELNLANVVVHPETAFAETVPMIVHADIGIAPYRGDGAPYYLADTSMKMRQYRYAGLPTVCPDFAVGTDPSRFGYDPGDPASIVAAVGRALASPRFPVASPDFPSWDEVVDRILDPAGHPETRL